MTRFSCILASDMESFLHILECTKKKTANHRIMLTNLDRYLIQNNFNGNSLDRETVLGWVSVLPGTTANKASYIARFRGFARYLRSIGMSVYEPEYPLVSHDYVPYIFSNEEWIKMIEIADSFSFCKADPESDVLFCIFLRILYGCGLRKSEALSIELRDIDLVSGILLIRHAKNDKQRYVPMSWSLNQLLRDYLSVIEQNRKYLFTNTKTGNRYSDSWGDKRLKSLLRQVGIKYVRNRPHERGPCFHCLRHTFVENSFNKLFESGLDFEDISPFISAYLGHSDIRETDKYLQAKYEFYRHDHHKITEYTQRLNIFPEVIDE